MVRSPINPAAKETPLLFVCGRVCRCTDRTALPLFSLILFFSASSFCLWYNKNTFIYTENIPFPLVDIYIFDLVFFFFFCLPFTSSSSCCSVLSVCLCPCLCLFVCVISNFVFGAFAFSLSRVFLIFHSSFLGLLLCVHVRVCSPLYVCVI